MRPLLIGRQAGLPLTALDALAAPELSAALRRLAETLDAAAGAGKAMSDYLFAIVPTLTDVRLRRRVLSLRRCAHTSVVREVDLVTATDLAAHLDDCADTLASWVALHRRIMADQAVLDRAPGALSQGSARSVQTLSAPAVLSGLSFASPSYARSLLDVGRRVPSAGSRATRSAVHYLTRATLKPSPFSTLGTVGAVQWSESGDQVPPTTPTRLRSTFRPLAMSVFLACLSHPDAWRGPGEWDIIDAETSGHGAKRTVLTPLYTKAHGVYFRHDELTAMPETGAHGAFQQQLAHGAESSARAVALGLVHPVTPWALTDSEHLAGLPKALAQTQLSAGVVKQVGVAARAEQELIDAADAPAIIAATDALRSAAGEVFAELGAPVPRWLADAPLAHESVSSSPTPPTVGRRALRRLESHLRDAVQVAPAYDQLTQHFIRTHGRGGRVGLLEFCVEVLAAMERLSVLPDAIARPVDRLPRGHLSLATPSSTVFFQQRTDTDGVVLNKLYPGYLGALARWAGLPAMTTDLEAEIAGIAAARHPGCRTYQYTASADWTAVQRPAAAALPLVRWGAERAARDDDQGPMPVLLTDFTIRHDVATGTLQVEDGAGPAALLYTGAVPPFLLSGVAAVLGMIGDPWTARLRGSTESKRRRFSPRVEVDGTVLRRAGWTFPATELPTWDGTGGPGSALLRIYRYWRATGLPTEVYVTAHRPGSTDHGKPAWLSLDHPLTALTVLRADPTVACWTVTEALPSVGDLHAAGVSSVTEYLAVLDHG